MAKLTDKSPMPYGKKHSGTALANVPASYLLWCWESGPNVPENLMDYIQDNYDLLVEQAGEEKQNQSRWK